MTDAPELKGLEQRAYGATYSDGILDMFVGLSLALIGAVWIVFPDYLSGATALVAVSISPMVTRRRRFVEARVGYVRFTEPRRRRERRIYTAAGFLFGAFMLIARPLGSLQPEDIDWAVGPDSLVAWLLALIAVALSFFVEGKRLLAYAAILTISGAAAVETATRFGWPLLVSGAFILAVGLAMLRQFINRYPRTDKP